MDDASTLNAGCFGPMPPTLPAFVSEPPPKTKRRTPVEVAADKAVEFLRRLRDQEIPADWSMALTLAWVQSGGLVRQ